MMNCCGQSAGSSCKIGCVLILVVLLVVAYFSFSSLLQHYTDQKNKEIVMQILHQGLETGNIDSYANEYFDPNVQLEYPPAFHLPPNQVNKVTGIDNVKIVAKAWKADTMHQVDIIDVVSDNDKVSVLINMDRIFQMDDQIVTHEDHPAMYFFYLKNGKIVKIIGVFDVLDSVEAFKDQKYPV